MSDYLSDDAVAHLVYLHGGELVGRTRLQKSGYFLERCGIGWGFDFEYHNYGPYSVDLAYAADLGVRNHKLTAEDRPSGYGIPFTIYRASENAGAAAGDYRDSERRELLSILRNAKPVPLELAATFEFLRQRHARRSASPTSESVWAEVRRLKPTKGSEDNIAEAVAVLKGLGPRLDPARCTLSK